MKMGHCKGTRKQTKKASSWYAAIEEANIRRIEQEYAEKAKQKEEEAA